MRWLKHVSRAVMIRADTVQIMMSIITKMESNTQLRTGLRIRIPYATLLDAPVRQMARQMRIADPAALRPSLDLTPDKPPKT